MRWRSRIAVLALAALAAVSPAQAKIKVGEPAPDFELTLIDGSKVALHDLRGQVVVLNFWATWCAPCVAELPTLLALDAQLGAQGLRVVAASLDRNYETIDRFWTQEILRFSFGLS